MGRREREGKKKVRTSGVGLAAGTASWAWATPKNASDATSARRAAKWRRMVKTKGSCEGWSGSVFAWRVREWRKGKERKNVTSREI